MILTICEELTFYLTICCFTGFCFFSKKYTTRYEITSLFEYSLNDLFPPSGYKLDFHKWDFRISKYHEDYNKLRFTLEKKIYDALKKNKSQNYLHSSFIEKQLMFHIVHILFDSLDDNGEFRESSSISFKLKELETHSCQHIFHYTQDEKKSLAEISTSFWEKFKIQNDGTLLDLSSINRKDHVRFEKKLITLLIKVINKKIKFQEVINAILDQVDANVLSKKNDDKKFLDLNSI